MTQDLRSLQSDKTVRASTSAVGDSAICLHRSFAT